MTTNAGTPHILGEQVVLRPRELGDAERALAWVNDREVARFLLLRYPQTLEQENDFLRNAGYVSFFNLPLAIETRDGVHIGNIDLRNVHPENRTAELGVMIGDKAYWGRGYGSDAVRTLTRFAFTEMNLQRVYLHTYEFNERGQAAFRKAGFQDEGRMRRHLWTEGRYWDVIIMGCLRDA